ncbi:MAG: homocysteine S-methyltransferase family protein [Verrucomicrobiales bacterium]|nr:homocysteine S-methyltransferase family protein [Verrucomicrobiales bacterium]
MKYRKITERLDDKICLTDGGLETELVFDHGIDLPAFASFTMFERPDGESIFLNYLQPYIDLAEEKGFAFQLVDSGWRANSDWGRKLGLNADQLEAIIRRSGEMMVKIREKNETPDSPMPIVGCIGPRGDGYVPGEKMSVDEAMSYHHAQIRILADTEADSITAMTLNYPEEAIGIIEAARDNRMPVMISFTVETDGRLPGGETLRDAIARCDAASGSYATGYMINCAHPSHFREQLAEDGPELTRIKGIRANASRRSHEELDNSTELDRGNPAELGAEMEALMKLLPNLQVVGGCCGTGIAHVKAIAEQCSVR